MTENWSRSTSCDTGSCVEVAFHKSSASTDANCVEVGYSKSSTSAGNGACVEVGYSKSSASNISGCVEVAPTVCDDPDCKYRSDKEGNLVLVRDSKDPDGPVLKFTEDEWAAFLTGALKGEFDLQVA